MRITDEIREIRDETVDFALEYAAKGWHVFPIHRGESNGVETVCTCGNERCPSPGKHPINKGWRSEATTDPDAIREMWNANPLANIGVACGRQSGIVVLDVDPRNGGNRSLDLLQQAAKMPKTLSSRTGGGGTHFIFTYPKNPPKWPKQLGNGLDVQADGRYILIPPSSHVSGGEYQWLTPWRLAEPDWLLERIAEQAPAERERETYATPRADSNPTSADIAYARQCLQMAADQVRFTREGDRNNTLNEQAYAIGGFIPSGALGFEEVVDTFTRSALACGLSPEEIEQVLTRAINDGMAAPRSLPSDELPDVGVDLLYDKEMYLSRTLIDVFEEGGSRPMVYPREEADFRRYDPFTGSWDRVTVPTLQRAFMEWDGQQVLHAGSKEEVGSLNVTARLVKNVTSLVQMHREEVDFFEEPADGVPFSNGRYLDGKILPHSPDNRYVHSLSFSYVPSATCRTWRRVLDEILPEEDCQASLQEFFGLTLMRDTWRLQKAMILEGDGNNGKSVVCDVLAGLLPVKAVQSVAPHAFKEKFSVVALHKAWLNVVTEVRRSELRETETLKAVIDGSPIRAEEKGQPGFTFRPRVACLFACNRLPVVRDQSRGFWRRMTVLPFRVTIPDEKVDRDLARNLLANEKEGIAKWALEGAERARKNLVLTEPKAGDAVLDEWQLDSDPVRRWVMECTEPSPLVPTSGREVYTAYKAWSVQNGHMVVASNTFGSRLKSLGIENSRTAGGVQYALLVKRPLG